MIEGLALILAGYAGYAAWPWWWAAILGALAGATNASRRVFSGPWRAQLQDSGAERSRAVAVLAAVCVWTATMCAILFSVVWLLVRWITSLLA